MQINSVRHIIANGYEQRKQIKLLVLSYLMTGYSIRETAKNLGLSKSTCHRIARGSQQKLFTYQKVIALLASGLRPTDVARNLGVSKSYVSQVTLQHLFTT